MPRIMIVDDDATIQMELEEYLTHMNHDVVGIADTGERAVAMAREAQPDLILMDVVMPGGMDGISAAEKIKGELDAAVVFVTGFDDPEYIERAKRVEPFGYLMKPFDEREIKGVVEISLHKRAMELKLARAHEALQKVNEALEREIEERRAAVVAVRKSEERFQRVAENLKDVVANVNDVLYATDEQGMITYISPRIRDVMGYDPSEIMGSSFMEFVHPDDVPHVREGLAEVRKSNFRIAERRLRAKSGEYLWVRITNRTIYREDRIAGFRGTFADITKERNLEQARHQARQMEGLCELAGGVAHDYNNLLSVIMGNLSMAKEDTSLTPQTRKLLDEIDKASYAVRDLTRRMMSLTGGGVAFKWRNGSILTLLSDCVERAMANSPVHCDLSLSETLYSVRYDPLQLEHVLNNVLTNALEAMPAGGTLTVVGENLGVGKEDHHTEPPLKPGEYVRITLQDQGPGIPPKDLPRVFDPYFSTKEKGTQKGMGLGLASAYAVIEKHGGMIDIHSTVGKGTCVTIYLPAESQRPETAGETFSENGTPVPADHEASPAKRILLMDDEEMLRNLGDQMLKRLGYECETVADGDAAIAAYEKAIALGLPFDAVMLDLTIKGGMGGTEAIKVLRESDPGVRAIVCSGYCKDPVLENFTDYGFNEALAKPYHKAELETVLQRVLGE